MLEAGPETKIDTIRRFNRFFTRRIGVLREGLLHTPYSLTEARILFEIANRDDLSGSDLSRELGLDPGYLSRILSEGHGTCNEAHDEPPRPRPVLGIVVPQRYTNVSKCVLRLGEVVR